MVKCPNCGSSAQPKVVATEYNENNRIIKIVRTYKCGCGQIFTDTNYHIHLGCCEIAEEIKNRG